MMKKHLFRIAALLVLCSMFVGCQKDMSTTIYGTLYDMNGDPVPNAAVVLGEGGSNCGSMVTGSDGQFEITFNYKRYDYSSLFTLTISYIYLGYEHIHYEYIYLKGGDVKRVDIRLVN